MKEITIEQMEYAIVEMKRLEVEHPKAKITFDTQKHRINITYPLSRDFWEIKDIKINNDHFRNIKR